MYEMKTCPSCGAQMFADMDVCYECLNGYCEEGERVPEEAYEEVAVPTSKDDGAWCLRISTSVLDVTVGIPKTGIVIGRGSSCDVVLHAQAVSRKHVSIEPIGSVLVVRDLGATNRATVNGRVIDEEATLRKGDVLEVCGTSFGVGRTNRLEHKGSGGSSK
ncbi:MAG: FHA domain-containing protein [Atopobiaceae bacterium]|nr:FHA domain-containing protein [Atopobiaceae bacterium]